MFLTRIGNQQNLCWFSLTRELHFSSSVTLFANMIVLHFSMQGEDIVKHTNGNCHVFTF